MQELAKRVTVAVVAIPIIVASLLYLNPAILAVSCLFLAGGACYEWYLITQTTLQVTAMILVGASLLIVLLPSVWLLPLLALFWLMGIACMISADQRALLQLRWLYPLLFLGGLQAAVWLWQESPWYLLNVTALIWLADSLAYLVGRSWGTWPLWPSVSPKKSWQGLLASLCPMFFWPMLPTIVVCLVIIAGVLGDLLESQFKRVFKVKDSSQLLPGHGGLLDRLDSLVAAWFISIFCLQYLKG